VPVARDYRVATRPVPEGKTGVRVPGHGLRLWSIGTTPMTASNARSVAKQLNSTYPEYEHVAVKVDKEGNPL